MKLWLKGGLIGAIAFLAFAIIILITNSSFLGYVGEFLEGIYLLKALKTGTITESKIYWVGWIYSVLVWFLIGALIGWIIGKIKAKKEQAK
jgi:uncharacterized membrane protein